MKRHPTSLRIAIILRDTLRRTGLLHLLYEIAPEAEIHTFENFRVFRTSVSTLYDLIFTEPEIIVLYDDYFHSLQCEVITVHHHLTHDTTHKNYLPADQSEETLRKSLLEIIDRKKLSKHDSEDLTLSSREVEVLKEVACGRTNKEIADALNISMNTVTTHRKNITTKLNIKTVAGLTFYALMNGLISGDEVVRQS